MEKQLTIYNGKVFGVSVSKYGLEHGYLDFKALASIVGDHILNNNIRANTMEHWELVNGNFDGSEMIFQDYIISEHGAKFLFEYTDEYVFHNEELDMYIWGVTHFGTSWDYVLTKFKLVNEEE